ncbi:signal peptidase subunit-domain-containing protein [Cantharellus anzutake]|uniref:signal peptidase subunit-domain-containing protein n=1 Tax=Cantharellus anzutake TaxID=1750568 RepID=UPI001902E49C|nr:signal peptidase subunit-domain-containing protein [Cantharellus anzutake]KAF8326640.1 signal peptidase subunit-domain-containing protein [Cantharellus anzutake]
MPLFGGTVSLHSWRLLYDTSNDHCISGRAWVNIDLTSLFHWNTKQLFVYLTAEYTNSKGVKNDVVLWDRIVRRKGDARINIEGAKNKYVFRDFSKSFRCVRRSVYLFCLSAMPSPLAGKRVNARLQAISPF